MPNTFLKAEWRKLIMINYSVDQKLLQPYLPHRTEIDLWKGTCYVSLVGFMFLNTKVRGVRIPLHINFAEVNLRFYVSHQEGSEFKRGTVFIKEIVPKPAITFVANFIYGEHYETLPMRHQWDFVEGDLAVEYQWKKDRWHSMKIIATPHAIEIMWGSEEEFITEHYWGYTRLGPEKTAEYQVEHPRWLVYPVKESIIDVDFGAVYGRAFDFLSHQKPQSLFLAEGSEVVVKKGRVI